VPKTERVCPRCGAGYVPFGEECCELIDWQVRLVRVVIRRPMSMAMAKSPLMARCRSPLVAR
jgi:hypothetical protein